MHSPFDISFRCCFTALACSTVVALQYLVALCCVSLVLPSFSSAPSQSLFCDLLCRASPSVTTKSKFLQRTPEYYYKIRVPPPPHPMGWKGDGGNWDCYNSLGRQKKTHLLERSWAAEKLGFCRNAPGRRKKGFCRNRPGRGFAFPAASLLVCRSFLALALTPCGTFLPVGGLPRFRDPSGSLPPQTALAVVCPSALSPARTDHPANPRKNQKFPTVFPAFFGVWCIGFLRFSWKNEISTIHQRSVRRHFSARIFLADAWCIVVFFGFWCIVVFFGFRHYTPYPVFFCLWCIVVFFGFSAYTMISFPKLCGWLTGLGGVWGLGAGVAVCLCMIDRWSEHSLLEIHLWQEGEQI